MDDLTQWLENLNEEFRRSDVPHKRRPMLAWMEWSKHTDESISFGDPVVNRIFEWFANNTKPGVQHIGPKYVGAFYFDSCIWPVFVPLIAGKVRINAWKSLEMPQSVEDALRRDSAAAMNYLSVWMDCVDYAYGTDDIKKTALSSFAREMFASGDQQLNATVTLLLEREANPKASESARLAVELFLKGLLACRGNLTADQARKEISHDLRKALDRYLALDPSSELRAVEQDLDDLPSMGDRYKGASISAKDLWWMYGIAQFTATTVIRTLTIRDTRKDSSV